MYRNKFQKEDISAKDTFFYECEFDKCLFGEIVNSTFVNCSFNQDVYFEDGDNLIVKCTFKDIPAKVAMKIYQNDKVYIHCSCECI